MAPNTSVHDDIPSFISTSTNSSSVNDSNVNDSDSNDSSFQSQSTTVMSIWQECDIKMTKARTLHAAVAIDDHRILVTGGIDNRFQRLKSAEVIDFWRDEISSLPEMSTARYNHVSVFQPHTEQIFAIGGYDNPDDSPTPRSSNSSTDVGGSKNNKSNRHHIGGSLKSVECLNLKQKTIMDSLCSNSSISSSSNSSSWSSNRQWEKVSSMIEARYDFAATISPYDNCIYVFGGRTDDFDPSLNDNCSSDCLRTDTSTCTTTQKSHLSVHTQSSLLSSVERYDITTNIWESIAPMAYSRASHVAVLVGQHIFILGGTCTDDDECKAGIQCEGENKIGSSPKRSSPKISSPNRSSPNRSSPISAAKTEIFHIPTQTWMMGPTMPIVLSHMTAIAVLDKYIMLIGGVNHLVDQQGTSNQNKIIADTFLILDTETYRWYINGKDTTDDKASATDHNNRLMMPRYEHVGVLLDKDKILIFGGLNDKGKILDSIEYAAVQDLLPSSLIDLLRDNEIEHDECFENMKLSHESSFEDNNMNITIDASTHEVEISLLINELEEEVHEAINHVHGEEKEFQTDELVPNYNDLISEVQFDLDDIMSEEPIQDEMKQQENQGIEVQAKHMNLHEALETDIIPPNESLFVITDIESDDEFEFEMIQSKGGEIKIQPEQQQERHINLDLILNESEMEDDEDGDDGDDFISLMKNKNDNHFNNDFTMEKNKEERFQDKRKRISTVTILLSVIILYILSYGGFNYKLPTFLTSVDGKRIQLQVANRKQVQVAGLSVDIMADSGKVNVMNRNSNLIIAIDDIREVSKDGNTIKSVKESNESNKHNLGFIIANNVEKDIKLMNEENVKLIKVKNNVRFEAAKGDKISFFKKLSNGSKIKIDLFLVNKMGYTTIGTKNGEAWPVFPGDLKFNFELSDWDSWMEEENSDIDIDIQIRIADGDGVFVSANPQNIDTTLGNTADMKLQLSRQLLKSMTKDTRITPEHTSDLEGTQSLTFSFSKFNRTNGISDSFLVWHALLSTTSLALIREGTLMRKQKMLKKPSFLLQHPEANLDLSKITNNAMIDSKIFSPLSTQEHDPVKAKRSLTKMLYKNLSWFVSKHKRQLLNTLQKQPIRLFFKEKPLDICKKLEEEHAIDSVETLCEALSFKKFERVLKQDYLHPWKRIATPRNLKRELRNTCGCTKKGKNKCILKEL